MNAERLLEHFEQISEAPDAVARLRRFILDLAVRGKLVEQDPEDEPVLLLLDEIKSRMRRLRLNHAFSVIDPSEIPFDEPSGWTWCRLGEVCVKTGSGSTPRGGKDVYKNAGVPFLRSQNIYDDGLRLEDVAFIDDLTHQRMAGTQVLPCDLLLNITGGSIGRCARVPLDFGEANISQHVAIIRVASRGMEEFLHSLILSPYFQGFVDKSQTGAGRGGLPKNRMDAIPIPLPPLAEQHRIVAKVDELMALCDQLEAARQQREQQRERLMAATLHRLNQPAEDPANFRQDASFALQVLPSLTTTPAQIKQQRQTILNLAVRGKLVEQDPDEATSALNLDELRKQKDLAYAVEGLRARKPITAIQLTELWFNFPHSWMLCSFDDALVIVSGVTKGQRIPSGETSVDVPYLRVANVQRGWLDLSEVKSIAVRASDVDRYRLVDQDILMTEGGDWDKLGRAAIWRGEIACCIHQNHIFRLRIPADSILPEWVVLYANSDCGRRFFEDSSKQTTNLASINLTQLRSCPIPLPPLAEQHRIVAKVDELMALCDQLEQQLSQADQQRQRLLEALLAEALESSKPALGSESRV